PARPARPSAGPAARGVLPQGVHRRRDRADGGRPARLAGRGGAGGAGWGRDRAPARRGADRTGAAPGRRGAPGGERGVRIVVTGDTHLGPRRRGPLPGALLAACQEADLILHTGDLTVPAVLDELGAYAPVAAVLGNVDGWDLVDRLP